MSVRQDRFYIGAAQDGIFSVSAAEPHRVHPLDFLPKGISIFLSGSQHGDVTVIGDHCIDDYDNIFPPGGDAQDLDHSVIIPVIPA